jgi:hypothetical protein
MPGAIWNHCGKLYSFDLNQESGWAAAAELLVLEKGFAYAGRRPCP